MGSAKLWTFGVFFLSAMILFKDISVLREKENISNYCTCMSPGVPLDSKLEDHFSCSVITFLNFQLKVIDFQLFQL